MKTKKNKADIRSLVRISFRPYLSTNPGLKHIERDLVSYAQEQYEERFNNPDDYYLDLGTISSKIQTLMPRVNITGSAFDVLLLGIQKAIMTDHVERIFCPSTSSSNWFSQVDPQDYNLVNNLIPLEQRNKIQRRESAHEQAIYLFQSYLKEQSGVENGNRFSHSNDTRPNSDNRNSSTIGFHPDHHNEGRYQYYPGAGNSNRNNSRCNHQNYTEGSHSKKDYYGPNRDRTQIYTEGSHAQKNYYGTDRDR